MNHLIRLTIVLMSLSNLHATDMIPWPEHPRPDFMRPAWVNLNGPWEFCFDPEDVGVKEEWFLPGKHAFDRKITVPFPWESRLSGIGNTEYKGVAWYRREVTIPDTPEWKGKNAWLIIGACDFETRVWINGALKADHVGGYTPIELKAGEAGERITIVVRARDITDPQQPTGKQVGWYTRNSGIWQTVYLEARSSPALPPWRALPDLKDGSVTLEFSQLRREWRGRQVRLSSLDNAFDAVTSVAEQIDEGGYPCSLKLVAKLEHPEHWTPENPRLYPARLELLDGDKAVDRVDTYLALREIGTAKAPGGDYNYITLNGRPIYLMGLLHQSFHPDGIYQYPDDATMRSDYELCKDTGINFVRIHIKTPIPRELYWADKLGVMVMQDIPNVWEHTSQARMWYESLLDGAIRRDFNHPSIFAWVDFNETWGLNNPGPFDADRQKWVAAMYRRTKELDPTRLVEDNSPCNYDHVVTDINSWHFYINDYAKAKAHIQEVVDKTHPGSEFNYIGGHKQADAPLINSEYGGISAGLGDQDISWSFKYLTNELRLHDKICGYIYTELSDIEWEHNGFVNYDRSPKEFGYDYWHPGFSLKDLNNLDFIVLDAEPCLRLKPGESRTVPVRISHWSDREAKALTLRWRQDWIDLAGPNFPPDGARRREPWQSRSVTWKPFQVVDVEDGIAATSTGGPAPGLGALLVELLDGEKVIARNYQNVWVEAALPRIEQLDDRRVALRFDPGDFAEWSWSAGEKAPQLAGIASEKACGQGTGKIAYRLRLPKELKLDELDGVQLLAELSAKAGDEKLDWPARRRTTDYPQTDVKKWPSTVNISVGGEQIMIQSLDDDPADARGVLSHVQQHHPGSYGILMEASVDRAQQPRILDGIIRSADDAGALIVTFEVPASAEHKGGLAIFGDKLGRFPLDPTVILTFRAPQKLGQLNANACIAVNRFADRQTTLIPSAQDGGHTWRFTTDRPADDWMSSAFSDDDWRKGKSGFGQPDTPNSIVGTRWKTSDIWLRTTVQIDDPARIASGSWRLHHDEDVEVYVNGKSVLSRKGFVTNYIDVPLDDKATKALIKGTNVIAVHCHQTGGGQNVDLGLRVMMEPGDR